MLGFIFRLFGERFAHKAISRHTGGILDVKFGFALLRDGRVPFRYKLLALGLAALLMAALVALELPVESLLAALVIGLPIDAVVDGLETIVGPILFGALLLPHLAPKAIVESIRAERALNQGSGVGGQGSEKALLIP